MCLECYSENSRITPLLEPENCLRDHTQYICSSCGRCICIDHDEKRNVYRWNFPFKTLDVAKLYLRTAEIACEDICAIYEIVNEKGRKSYKIFHTEQDLREYLRKNPNKLCSTMSPVYISKSYLPLGSAKVRKLYADEVNKYLKEQKKSI